MNYASENPFQTWGLVAADAQTNERASFIRKTYLHLAGAILAFLLIEGALLSTPLAGRLSQTMLGNGQLGWLAVMAAFVGVSWLANSWASSSTSVPTQYLGLGLYVVAQAVIFLPLMYVAQAYDPNLILMAGVLTAVIFLGLTAAVFISGADFSFLRGALVVGGMAAIATILGSMFIGFNLGLVFIAAMIVLAGGYIVYDTSNVLHHYRIGQHVAAALALFASVALMFWYILQLLMSLSSRD